MNKEIIEITYTDLRRLSDKVVHIISEVTLIQPEKITLKSSINNQLGIDGDDWFLIQERIQKDLNFDFKDFNYHNFFFEEGSNVLKFPIRIFSVISRVFNYAITLPFNEKAAKSMWKNKNVLNKPDLKIEDLITL